MEEIDDRDRIEVPGGYPEPPYDGPESGDLTTFDLEVETLVVEARQLAQMAPASEKPLGHVCNARNATSTSEEFTFWVSAEATEFAVGSIVRHDGPSSSNGAVRTYGIVTSTEGQTLGLDDLAVDVYEFDGRPPIAEIVPAPSRRRPVVICRSKVLSGGERRPRPVLAGPVRPVGGDQIPEALGRLSAEMSFDDWLRQHGMLLGFYEDAIGEFGIFAEERSRVLGPKQGHIVLSGLPGAGKTSQFLTLLIALYAQLGYVGSDRTIPTASPQVDDSGGGVLNAEAPTVAALAFNIKGADLLFLDHLDDSSQTEADRRMWDTAGVDITIRPFKRVIYYVPLAEDGLNRHSLRTNTEADVEGYSETHEFGLGIADLWPHLDLLFDDRSMAAATLLAEIRLYFDHGKDSEVPRTFTLAQVLNLFQTSLLKSEKDRKNTDWEGFSLSTIRTVYRRLRGLSAMFGGLIDAIGTGFGLEKLTDLQAGDLIIVDLERILADPADPELADIAIKIVTSLVLHKLTEAITKGGRQVDHAIVFADELNRLAPAQGDSGVGEYLAHLARTTRDRGIVLFGAGQFRSGINRDILKAAAVHFSMQTPEYELKDPIYSGLSPEFKARLTQLRPGEALLQFPSLRTPVFSRFPYPFVLMGTQGLERFPRMSPRPMSDCIAERLARIEPARAPDAIEVADLIDGLRQSAAARAEVDGGLLGILRDVEMEKATPGCGTTGHSPWQRFERLAKETFGPRRQPAQQSRPPGFGRSGTDEEDLDEEYT